MRLADDRRHVMLAEAFEADIAESNHLVISFDFLEGPLKHVDRVLIVARKPFSISADDAARRIEKPLAVGVITCPAEQGTNRLARLFLGRPGWYFCHCGLGHCCCLC